MNDKVKRFHVRHGLVLDEDPHGTMVRWDQHCEVLDGLALAITHLSTRVAELEKTLHLEDGLPCPHCGARADEIATLEADLDQADRTSDRLRAAIDTACQCAVNNDGMICMVCSENLRAALNEGGGDDE